MTSRVHLSQEFKWRAVERMEAGQTQSEVARWLEINRNVVSKLWRKFQETGTVSWTPGQGRPRSTTPSQDRYQALTARRNRRQTSTQLRTYLNATTGVLVSTDTIRRRLRLVGLYARKPVICVPLTPDTRGTVLGGVENMHLGAKINGGM